MEATFTQALSAANSWRRCSTLVPVRREYPSQAKASRGRSAAARCVAAAALLFCFAFSGCGGGRDAGAPQPEHKYEGQNMPHGFRVIGDHGVVQIDQDYTNLALVQAGSVFVPAGLAGAQVLVSNVTWPIFCVRTPSGAPVNVTSNQALPNPTYTLRSATSATVEWYVFGKNAPTSTGCGITVRRADGSIAFNSDWKVMKIGAASSVPAATDPYAALPATSVSAPYAAKWAACLTAARVLVDDGGGARVAFIHADGIATNGNSATTGDVPVAQIAWDGAGPQIQQPLGGTILLVDVSGY